jgi:hypothetical protein
MVSVHRGQLPGDESPYSRTHHATHLRQVSGQSHALDYPRGTGAHRAEVDIRGLACDLEDLAAVGLDHHAPWNRASPGRHAFDGDRRPVDVGRWKRDGAGNDG